MYCILLDDWNPRNYPVGWISPHFLTPLTANIWFWAVSHAVLTSKDELCQRLSPYRFLPRSGCPFHFTAGVQVPAFESSWHSLWRLAPGRNFQEIHSGSGNLKGGSCWAAIFFQPVFSGWKVARVDHGCPPGRAVQPIHARLFRLRRSSAGLDWDYLLLYLQGISMYCSDD